MNSTKARGLCWKAGLVTVMALLLFGMTAMVEAGDLPAVLDVEEIQRIDFYRSDTSYLPLFPDIAEDRSKIERLVELYNQAVSSLGEEASLY